MLPAPVLASSLAGALLTATLLVARVTILPARKLQKLMKHIVVLGGELVDLPTLHFLQFAVDD